MEMFSKTKSPEELAEKARQRAQQEEQREREAFQRTPVGQARTAFERGRPSLPVRPRRHAAREEEE